jgi:hypothetical protein
MGGYRSGRRYEAKERVEQCITLSLSWMLQNDCLDLGVGHTKYSAITWSNYRCEPTYQLTAELERLSQYEMRLYLRNTGQVVYLHPTSLHFGGVRWWFSCPGCGRRCAKLHLRRGSVFQCRTCHDLTYESCIEGKSTAAFLATTGASLGLSVSEVKREIAEDTRARNKWRRKRDRRPSYRGRPGRQR